MKVTPPLGRTAVFLDRDGTLNVEAGYIRNVDDLHLIVGAAQAIKKLNDAGHLAILTTNQTGPARGYYDETHVHALNHRLETLLNQEGNAFLDKVYYCPHLENGSVQPYAFDCNCRKPKTGMIEQALSAFPEINLSRSYVIGDKASDIDFAKNAGCKGILLKTGYGQQVLEGNYQTLNNPPATVCDSIVEAVDWILSQA